MFLARKLNTVLYEKAKKSDNLGLDIKTQITLNAGNVETAIVAIPMLKDTDLTDLIVETLGQKPRNIIVNGTGRYTYHASVADCGMTGRKLACDFYGAACPIGGGSPWTKDPSKADLTLNLYARALAVENLKENDACFVYLSSCIGKAELISAVVKTLKAGKQTCRSLSCHQSPKELIKSLGLNRPIYTKLCQKGLQSFVLEENLS